MPEVLADHILDEACFRRTGRSTGYAERVYRVFGEIGGARLLRNLAQVDSRMRSTRETADDVFSPIWDAVIAGFESAPVSERLRLLGEAKEIAPFQPQHALALARRAARRLASDDDRPSLWQSLLSRVAEVAHTVAFHPEYLPPAARLLWDLNRLVMSDDRESPAASALCDLLRHRRRSLAHRLALIELVESWLDERLASGYEMLVLDLLDAALARHGEETFATAPDTFTFQMYFLVDEAEQPLRDRALTLASRLLHHSDDRIAIRAGKTYVRLAKSLHAVAGAHGVPDELRDGWRAERLLAIDELKHFVISRSEPLVSLEVLAELRLSAAHETDEEIRAALHEVFSAFERTEDVRLTAALVDSRDHRYGQALNEDSGEAERERRWQQHLDELRALAEHVIRKFSPQEFLLFAAETLSTAKSLGLSIDPLVLIGQLAELNPSFLSAVAQHVLSDPSHPLAAFLDSLIGGVIQSDRAAGIAMARDAVASADVTVALGAIGALPSSGTLDPVEREITERLWLHPAPAVRAAAIEQSRRLVESNLDFVTAVLPALDLTDEAVAKAFAHIFNQHGTPPAALGRSLVAHVLGQFRTLHAIDDYWICDFIAEAAHQHPRDVVEMLLGRIADAEGKEGDDAPVPLPHSPIPFDRNALARHSEYEDAVRAVREATLSDTWQRHWYLPDLFSALASPYEPRVRALLEEWFASGDEEKIDGAARLLSKTAWRFVFDEMRYVVAILDRASAVGEACFRSVAGHLQTSAVVRMKSGTHGKPFPQDEELRELSTGAMEDLQRDSPGWRFYDQLRADAQRSIDWKLARDEAEEL